jgi:hypothetical protein
MRLRGRASPAVFLPALLAIAATAPAQLREVATDEFRIVHPGGTESFVIPTSGARS